MHVEAQLSTSASQGSMVLSLAVVCFLPAAGLLAWVSRSLTVISNCHFNSFTGEFNPVRKEGPKSHSPWVIAFPSVQLDKINWFWDHPPSMAALAWFMSHRPFVLIPVIITQAEERPGCPSFSFAPLSIGLILSVGFQSLG